MTPPVLIVGAGLAGLAAARELRGAGLHPLLLERARGVSGRAATRRVPLPGGSEARIDHGARFFTARHDRTLALAEAGLRDGWNAVWTRSVAVWTAGTVTVPPPQYARYAPPGGASALGRHLARGLDVHSSVTVSSLERRRGGWRVHTPAGQYWDAPRLLLNLPAPQLTPLIGDLDLRDTASETAALAAAQVRYAPCWAAGVILNTEAQVPDWRALKPEHPVLEWVAREHTKRPAGHPPALTLHATPAWSAANLERAPEHVLPELLAAAGEILGAPLDFSQAFAHRWRFALPTRMASGPCHWDAALGLGWCGDWFTPDAHGPRVESALLSGWTLAGRVSRHEPHVPAVSRA